MTGALGYPNFIRRLSVKDAREEYIAQYSFWASIRSAENRQADEDEEGEEEMSVALMFQFRAQKQNKNKTVEDENLLET